MHKIERKKCNAVANNAPNHINLQFSVAKNGPSKKAININSNIIEYWETLFWNLVDDPVDSFFSKLLFILIEKKQAT